MRSAVLQSRSSGVQEVTDRSSGVQEVAARGRLGVDRRMLSFNRTRSSSSSLRVSKGQDEVGCKFFRRMDDDSSLGTYSLGIKNVRERWKMSDKRRIFKERKGSIP